MNLINKEVIADNLLKYDTKKRSLKKNYIIKNICSIALAIISILLVIVGNEYGNYFLIFVLSAVVLFIIACKLAKSFKYNYRYELAGVWKDFIRDDFITMIKNLLEGGQYGFGVNDDTFNCLETGKDVNAHTHGVVSSIYNSERITVANYRAYTTKIDKYTDLPYDDEHFNGIVVMKDIKKNIESEIVITSTYLEGLLDFSRISMDNSRFNKQFSTYTLNNMDAYIALTPAIMEAMLDVVNDFKVTAIVIKNKRLYVFINEEKLIFNMQKERQQRTKEYKKALKYMTVEHTYQNLSDFMTKYLKIIDSINKIKI